MYRPRPKSQTHKLLNFTEQVKEKQQKNPFSHSRCPRHQGCTKVSPLTFPHDNTSKYVLSEDTHISEGAEILTVSTKSSCSRYLCSVSSSSLAVLLRFLSHRARWCSTVFAPTTNGRDEALMAESGLIYSEAEDPGEPSKMDTQQKNNLCHRVGF